MMIEPTHRTRLKDAISKAYAGKFEPEIEARMLAKSGARSFPNFAPNTKRTGPLRY
jgi:hypothetical protein